MSGAGGCVKYNWGEPSRGVYFGGAGGDNGGERGNGGERDGGGDCGVGYVFGDCDWFDAGGIRWSSGVYV